MHILLLLLLLLQVEFNLNILYSYVVNNPGNHDVLLNGYGEAISTLCG